MTIKCFYVLGSNLEKRQVFQFHKTFLREYFFNTTNYGQGKNFIQNFESKRSTFCRLLRPVIVISNEITCSIK
jgi:uncharacterized FlgJ-related protein